MKRCEEISGQIWPFLLQEIDAPRATEVEQHLQACPACQKEYDETVYLFGELKSVPLAEPSDHFFSRQAQQIQEKIQTSRWFHLPHGWRPALAAAAVITVLWVGGSMFHKITDSPSGSVDQAAVEQLAPPSPIHIEYLNSEQLNQLTDQLEKIVMQKLPVLDFFGDSGDVDDLDEQELDHLIKNLETADLRRNS